ncbi:MAG: intradiol ring-cleavage dioxygenase [Marivirga sp.]|nr:intradiol ring-cleavage dioxygenase [Marivirga sp.]
MNTKIILTCVLFIAWVTGCTQSGSREKIVGGDCEDCSALHEFGSKKLTWFDTLPDYEGTGPKLEVSGTIYQRDGKTPAENIILYIYHTDRTGEYPTKGTETGWAKRHGYIRGWIKTDSHGKYKFLTLRPAAYPGRRNPEHIHATVKEPGLTEYWIDEYLFDDDPILNTEERTRQKKRGGSGIVKLTKNSNGIMVAHRDIILGLNIPDYE